MRYAKSNRALYSDSHRQPPAFQSFYFLNSQRIDKVVDVFMCQSDQPGAGFTVESVVWRIGVKHPNYIFARGFPL